jgi:hypothetical protein
MSDRVHWEVWGGTPLIELEGRRTLVVVVVHLFSKRDAIDYARNLDDPHVTRVEGRKRTRVHVPKRRGAKGAK